MSIYGQRNRHLYYTFPFCCFLLTSRYIFKNDFVRFGWTRIYLIVFKDILLGEFDESFRSQIGKDDISQLILVR